MPNYNASPPMVAYQGPTNASTQQGDEAKRFVDNARAQGVSKEQVINTLLGQISDDRLRNKLLLAMDCMGEHAKEERDRQIAAQIAQITGCVCKGNPTHILSTQKEIDQGYCESCLRNAKRKDRGVTRSQKKARSRANLEARKAATRKRNNDIVETASANLQAAKIRRAGGQTSVGATPVVADDAATSNPLQLRECCSECPELISSVGDRANCLDCGAVCHQQCRHLHHERGNRGCTECRGPVEHVGQNRCTACNAMVCPNHRTKHQQRHMHVSEPDDDGVAPMVMDN